MRNEYRIAVRIHEGKRPLVRPVGRPECDIECTSKEQAAKVQERDK
jgi:hypothetical protein